MPSQNASLLFVEDQAAVRQLLSIILTKSGYRVRSAEDGFSALAEIRNEIPDIILSDLYMPGMSGFELLSVVRRRFPAIQVIATSVSFSGLAVPPGIAADAFYEKGSSPECLRAFPQVLGSENRLIHETGCVNCSTPIHYAIVQKENQVSSLSNV